MRIFKRGSLQRDVDCKACEAITTQTFAGQSGTPWSQVYCYRCGCGAINNSKIAPLEPEKSESAYEGLKRFLRSYALKRT